MAKKARVLADTYFEGRHYKPNDVVEFDDKTAKALEKEGYVDSNADAVAYCLEQGAECVKHSMPEEEVARIERDGEALAAETTGENSKSE